MNDLDIPFKHKILLFVEFLSSQAPKRAYLHKLQETKREGKKKDECVLIPPT